MPQLFLLLARIPASRSIFYLFHGPSTFDVCASLSGVLTSIQRWRPPSPGRIRRPITTTLDLLNPILHGYSVVSFHLKSRVNVWQRHASHVAVQGCVADLLLLALPQALATLLPSFFNFLPPSLATFVLVSCFSIYALLDKLNGFSWPFATT